MSAYQLEAGDFTCSLGPIVAVFSAARLEVLAQRGGLDAIVSSDHSQLLMDGGVSRAIAGVAGPDVLEEVGRSAPQEVGALVITGAGSLPLKFILHAVTVDWKKLILPSDRTIRQIARQIFVRCEALGVRRLAVPAFGTGGAGFPPQRAAALILQTLVEHILNPTTLEWVVFSLPDTEVREVFKSWMVDLDALHGPGGPPDEYLRARPSPQDSPPGRFLRLWEKKRIPVDREKGPAPHEESPVESLPIEKEDLSLERAKIDMARCLSELSTASVLSDGAAPDRQTEPSLLDRHKTARPLVGGRYVLLEELGRGGMGVVYLSWDVVLRRTVSLKVLRPGALSSPLAVESLRHEAAIAIDLTHEAILRVYHFEPHDAEVGPYLVMEFLPWSTGEKWIADAGAGKLPIRSVLDVGTQLCSALGYAHDKGVLHGDIKPGNIFVDHAGERAKLADFGLARVLAGSKGRALPLRRMGTPAYMAPEQWTHGAKVGPATDIYMLAASLWDFVTGQPPPAAYRADEKVGPDRRKVLHALRRALNQDPDSRPRSAFEFRTVLEEAVASL